MPHGFSDSAPRRLRVGVARLLAWRTAAGGALGRRLLTLLLATFCLAAAGTSHAAQPRKFLTFSSALSDDWVKRHGSEYVFVWGESDGNTDNPRRARVWSASAPATRLSSYFPYGRDPARRPPSEWLRTHPDWIVYRCDGKTMATLFDRPIVPLDISNPAVERWQIDNFMRAAHGDIALDNFATANVEHACGVMRGGKYVELYSSRRAGQQAFAQAKVAWLERVTNALHARGKTVTLNYQLDQPLDSPLLARIVAATDAVLDEEVYPAHSVQRYRALSRFADLLREKGKALYMIYQVQAVTPGNVGSAMAAYLINASPNSAIYITGVQQYGVEPKYFGYDRSIGEPCEPYRLASGFFTRRYTQGIAVVRDPESNAGAFMPGTGYVEVDNKPAGRAYPLAPAQGLVLYRAQPRACSAPA